MVKRIISLVLAASLTLVSLAGCDFFGNPDPAPPTPGTSEVLVLLFLPNDNVDGFVTKTATTDGTAEHIVSLLVEKNALPAGSAALSFSLDQPGRSCAVDMNASFGDAVSNTGTTGEYMMIGSLVNTLLTFFDVDKITLTIEKKQLITGHSIYDHPLTFYHNAGIGGNEHNCDTLLSAIASASLDNSLGIIWDILSGYWITATTFVGFFYHEGSRGLDIGIMDTSWLGFGQVVKAAATGELEFHVILHYPPVAASMIDDGRSEMFVTVYFDISGLCQDGKINIRTDVIGDNKWLTYMQGESGPGGHFCEVHDGS